MRTARRESSFRKRPAVIWLLALVVNCINRLRKRGCGNPGASSSATVRHSPWPTRKRTRKSIHSRAARKPVAAFQSCEDWCCSLWLWEVCLKQLSVRIPENRQVKTVCSGLCITRSKKMMSLCWIDIFPAGLILHCCNSGVLMWWFASINSERQIFEQVTVSGKTTTWFAGRNRRDPRGWIR